MIPHCIYHPYSFRKLQLCAGEIQDSETTSWIGVPFEIFPCSPHGGSCIDSGPLSSRCRDWTRSADALGEISVKDEWARGREELGETSDHQIDSKPGERRGGTG